MIFFLTLFAVVSIVELGILTDFYINQRKIINLNFSKVFGLGLGVLTILLLLLSFFEIRVTQFLATLLSLIFFIPVVIDRRLKITIKENIKRCIKCIKITPLYISIPLLFFAAFLFMMTFSKAVWGYDAYERWLAKARTFWVDGGINSDNVAIYDPADDHNLWPLTASWLYFIIGESDEVRVRIFPLIVYFAIVFEFSRHLDIKNKSSINLAWLSVLVFTPFLWQTVTLENYSGNADLIVSFFFILTIGALLKREFIYSSIFVSFAALSKNDALPALLGYVVFLPIIGGGFSNKNNLRLAFLIALFALTLNLVWKNYYSLESRYLKQDFSQIILQKPFLKYNKYSLHAFREQFRQTNLWAAGWWIIFFVLCLKIKIIVRNKLVIFTLILISVQILGYFTVYYISQEDQATQIATSISRVVLQIYPAVLLIAYYTFNLKEKGLLKLKKW